MNEEVIQMSNYLKVKNIGTHRENINGIDINKLVIESLSDDQ